MREGVRLDLEPSRRQSDFGMDRTGAIAPGSALSIGARLIHEPEHVASRIPRAADFAGLRIEL